MKAIMRCTLSLFFVGSLLAQSENDPFVGTFSGSGLTVILEASGGSYKGYAEYQGQRLALTAQKMGQMLIGTYTMQGLQFPFQAQVQNNTMTLNDGQQIFTMQRANAAAKTQVAKAAETKTAGATAQSAIPGEISEPSLGLKFNPPKGWKAQKMQAGYLLGHDTMKGFMMVLPHQYSTLDQLRAAAREGMHDNQGTALKLAGTPVAFGKEGIAAEFSGLVEGKAAKAYAVGMLSGFGGGATVLIAVEEQSYSAEYQKTAQTLAKSMKFSKPQKPSIVEEWRQTLNGARLTYMWRYYSGSADGSYVGGGEEVKIDLCQKGYFRYMGSSDLAADGGSGYGYNAGGYSGGNNQGSGQWEVDANGQQPILRLKFHNGRVYEYALSYEDGKTFLDGKRYFRTYAGDPIEEHRPQCW